MMKAQNEEKLHTLSDEELANVTGGLFGGYADVSMQCFCRYCGRGFATTKEREAHEEKCPDKPTTRFI